MKRIYLSLLIIFATVVSVMGLAYAYFTSNAVTMTGITLATGTPSIQISASGVDASYGLSITGFTEDNMYPGWTGTGHQFFLRNTSNGMVIAKIIPTISVAGTPPENWAIFKGLVEASFTGNNTSTVWKTLDYWQTNADAISLPLPAEGMSAGGAAKIFTIQFRFPTGGNDVLAQGKQIDGMAWSFVGRTP